MSDLNCFEFDFYSWSAFYGLGTCALDFDRAMFVSRIGDYINMSMIIVEYALLIILLQVQVGNIQLLCFKP